MSITTRIFSAALLFAFGFSADLARARDITKFEVVDLACHETTTERLVHASRLFHLDGLPRALVTDAETFESEVVDPKHLDCEDPSARAEVDASRFGRALEKSTAAPYPIRDDGVTHALVPVNGVFLSADLCPASHEKFEYRFFNELEVIAHRAGVPVPIAIAISGKWLRKHTEDFDMLRLLSETGKISITWVNHSDTHPYRRGEKMEDNFLLESGLNPDAEIENVEFELLSRNEIPSTYFRFPGLVSNEKWIRALKRHSLIPVGADAWLALDEKPVSGSIILVHANGNEPEGISKFLKTIKSIEALGPFLPFSALF